MMGVGIVVEPRNFAVAFPPIECVRFLQRAVGVETHLLQPKVSSARLEPA